ncbi:hypothetical protein PT2222_80228 [Paraburkholderia tropica]
MVRCSSRTESVFSSPRIAWLSAERDTPSSPAACTKLRRAATVMNAWRSASVGLPGGLLVALLVDLRIGEFSSTRDADWRGFCDESYRSSMKPTFIDGAQHDEELADYRRVERPWAGHDGASAGARRRRGRDAAQARRTRRSARAIW